MSKLFILFSLYLLAFPLPSQANDKTIIMGYKAIAKPPLIGDNEDNSGLYFDLFNKAAQRIGYKLLVVRIPKKRLHVELRKGHVDFYPGSSFSVKRADYLYYLPNGLQTKEVLVSLGNRPEITNIADAKGRLIVELSSSKLEWDQIYPQLTIVKMGKLSMGKVIAALKSGRGDFYVADIEIVDHYQKLNDIEDYQDIGIKIHQHAINKEWIPMNMGFARNSGLYAEKPNPDFSEQAPLGPQNFYTQVDKNSVAYKFYKALNDLKKEGFTQSLYDRYFH